MLKKTVTYTNFNGTETTEDLYFNLSNAELAEMELRSNLKGGMQTHLQTIVQSNDGELIMDTFRMIISKSYGEKSEDGRRFLKSEEISAGFLGSEAYSVVFMELISDPDKAADFINAIVPANISAPDSTVPGRPTPQDYRPSAREVFAEQKTVNVFDAAKDPGSNKPTKDQDDYQEYLRWKQHQQEGTINLPSQVGPGAQTSNIDRPPHELSD